MRMLTRKDLDVFIEPSFRIMLRIITPGINMNINRGSILLGHEKHKAENMLHITGVSTMMTREDQTNLSSIYCCNEGSSKLDRYGSGIFAGDITLESGF